MKKNFPLMRKLLIKNKELGRSSGKNIRNVAATDMNGHDPKTSSHNSNPVPAKSPSPTDDDPWLISDIKFLERSVVKNISKFKSKVTGIIIASVPSESSPPSLTNEDKKFISDEAKAMMERIKTSSASLEQDLELINKKLSMFPWLIGSENFRVSALRKLRLLGEEEENVDIFVRECKARLGEREILNSPGVRILSMDGGGMRGVATLLMLEELEKITGVKTHQMFDLIVGTSTGALIASIVGISCVEAKEGLEQYMKMGRKVFGRSLVGGVGGLI